MHGVGRGVGANCKRRDMQTSHTSFEWHCTKFRRVASGMVKGEHTMARWRERAIREVRDELDRYLNFPINQDISLGQYGTYDGKHCRFEWCGNISDFGIEVKSGGFQHEIAETYATAGAVNIQGNLGIPGANPRVSINFRRNSALAFRGFGIGFDQVQMVKLSKLLSEAIEKGLEWNRSWVIVTQLWRADGFTHLVSGGWRSGVEIEATSPSAPTLFNYADPGLGLNVVTEHSMSYCAVGAEGTLPYFCIHKLRESSAGIWSLYKYGG